MPEILTESFCERCGTRYTFQAAAAARGPLTRVRTLSKGFRNYVLSDETSLSEAMASARSDDLRRTSGEQLDAFHKAFNFCMSCRQYTCANCWNDIEGRCLSCAPGTDAAGLNATTFPLLEPVIIGQPQLDGGNGNGHANGSTNGVANGHLDTPLDGSDVSAWPSIDLEPEGGAIAAAADTAAPEAAVSEVSEVEDTVVPQAFMPEAHAPEVFAPVEPEAVAPAEIEAGETDSADLFAETFPLASPGEPEVEKSPPAVVASLETVVEPDPVEAVAHAEPVEALGQAADAEPIPGAAAIADVGAEPVADAPAPAEAEAAAVAEVTQEPEPEPIADLEGWAASAAAQTSTLFDRFRAFPGKRSAQSKADSKPAPAMDDRPLSVPLPTVAVDVTPVMNLFADGPIAKAGVQATPVEGAAADVVTPTAEEEAAPTVEVAPALEPEPVAALQPEPEPEPVATAPIAEPEAIAEPESIVEPEPVAAAPVVEPEPEPVAEIAPIEEPEPEPVAAMEPVLEPAPEPITAAPEPESAPEPVAAAPEPAPLEPPPTPVAPPTPVWQIVAPDLMPPSAIPTPTPAPTAQPVWPPLAKQVTGPQWPTAPSWPTHQPTGNIVSGADAVWAQSSRDLLNRPETGVQACVNCGLPLSARARFCRRCGTNQVSA